MEFQSPLIESELDDYARLEWLEAEGRRRTAKLLENGEIFSAKFPTLPQNPDIETLLGQLEGKSKEKQIPIGYSLKSGEPVLLCPPYGSCFLISGGQRTGKRTLLRGMCKSLLQQDYEAALADFGRKMEHIGREERITRFSELSSFLYWLRSPVRREIGLFISDLSDFCSKLYGQGEKDQEAQKILEQEAAGSGKLSFMAGIYQGRDYETESTEFFKKFTEWQLGIHLGGNALEQGIFNFEDLGYALLSRRESPGIGYYKAGDSQGTQRLLLPGASDLEGRKL